MDRYDPYTDKFLRDTQYGILGTNLAEVGTDCISRQAAIDALDSEITITGRTNAEAVRGYVRLVKDRLERLPYAEPKKGKWIHHPEWEDDGDCGYECSECHMGSDVDYNFCMRCGADMRGEQDDT